MTPEREAVIREYQPLAWGEILALRAEVGLTQEHLHDAIAVGADATTELLALRGENARLREAVTQAETERDRWRASWQGRVLAFCDECGKRRIPPEAGPDAIVPAGLRP